MMRIHREPRHLFSPRKSRKDEAGLTTYKVDQIGDHPVNLVIQKSNECPSPSKEKPTTAEIMYPGAKSTMICDGPQSRPTKSTAAAIATGSLHSYWVVAIDTIDSRVAEILLWKLESIGNLQGDSTKDFEEILSAIQKKERMKVGRI